VGIVTDGSDPSSQYADNQNCDLTIQAPPGVAILLRVVRFYTESTFDKLTIFDGSTVTAKQIVALSGNIPSRDPVLTTSNSLTLTWVTDGSTERTGYEVKWIHTSASPFNICLEEQESDTLVDDGSLLDHPYQAGGSSCSRVMTIDSAGDTYVAAFVFHRLDLAPGSSVEVRDGNNSSGPLLAQFTGRRKVCLYMASVFSCLLWCCF
jgi:hypothetical protein